jgi:endonuclease YncB( thermonuclease family)
MKRERPAHSLSALQIELAARVGELERQRAVLAWLAHIAPVGRPRTLLEQSVASLERRLDRWRGLLREVEAQRRRWASLLQEPAVQSGEIALVRHVPDGDGLELADGRRVRYLGIDAPEVGGQHGHSQPWAEEAKAFNERLVLGREVRLVRDVSDVDPHGRLLRYVFCDGMFVNAQLLLAGLARLMIIPPDTRHAALLERCQAAAQQARVGMWA